MTGTIHSRATMPIVFNCLLTCAGVYAAKMSPTAPSAQYESSDYSVQAHDRFRLLV